MPFKSLVVVPSNNTNLVISLESAGIFFSILVSVSLLTTIVIRTISKFNSIQYQLKSLTDELKKHAATEGHELLVARVRQLENLDKRLDLHIQDYINRKDTVQMLLGQLNEKLDHKSHRLYNSLRDIEKYLLNQGYKIRENQEEDHE